MIIKNADIAKFKFQYLAVSNPNGKIPATGNTQKKLLVTGGVLAGRSLRCSRCIVMRCTDSGGSHDCR